MHHAACILSSPAWAAQCCVRAYVICMGCSRLGACLCHLRALHHAAYILLSPAGAAPCRVHPCDICACRAMLHAFLRHLCGPGPEKRKKKRRFDHERTTGITYTHTNCPPYIVHPTQSTTNYHSVSRHTDDQNNSVVVAVVNILHNCRTVRSLPSSYVIPNGTS